MEDQAYSNNPIRSITDTNEDKEVVQGRLNPILPRNVQDQLESWGILTQANSEEDYADTGPSAASIKSTQSINLKQRIARNVVAFQVETPSLFSKFSSSPSTLRGTVTGDISFKPSTMNPTQIDVKFKACRIRVSERKKLDSSASMQKELLDLKIPLGFVGPTGWLRTTYIDDEMRITRGHKGSVFILTRF